MKMFYWSSSDSLLLQHACHGKKRLNLPLDKRNIFPCQSKSAKQTAVA